MMRDNFDRRYVRYVRPRGFISNIGREYVDIARQAAKDTGFPIDIREEAVDAIGHSLPDDVSVWTRAVDHNPSPFWKRYRELKQEASQ